MASKRFLFLACAATAASLTACTGTPVDKKLEFGSQYWQRINVSESVYIRGPKAQQMLNRDISRCVTELRELERLGVMKNSIPVDGTGRVLDPDDKELEDWDTPERDRHLFAEHTNFHDFDSCMLAGGWERTSHVPFDVAERARDVYIQEHIDYKYRSRFEKEDDVGDYGNLNQ